MMPFRLKIWKRRLQSRVATRSRQSSWISMVWSRSFYMAPFVIHVSARHRTIDIILTISSYILLTLQITAGYPPTIWSANPNDSSDDDDDEDDSCDSQDHFFEQQPDGDTNSDIMFHPIPPGGMQSFFSRFGSCATSDWKSIWDLLLPHAAAQWF